MMGFSFLEDVCDCLSLMLSRAILIVVRKPLLLIRQLYVIIARHVLRWYQEIFDALMRICHMRQPNCATSC